MYSITKTVMEELLALNAIGSLQVRCTRKFLETYKDWKFFSHNEFKKCIKWKISFIKDMPRQAL